MVSQLHGFMKPFLQPKQMLICPDMNTSVKGAVLTGYSYSQMYAHVIVQAFSPHLLVVNRVMAHVYSVQCSQCIHRNAANVMLQNSDNVYASRDHSDILRNVLHI